MTADIVAFREWLESEHRRASDGIGALSDLDAITARVDLMRDISGALRLLDRYGLARSGDGGDGGCPPMPASDDPLPPPR